MSVQVPPTVVVAKVLGEELEGGEEVLAWCLANVCRQVCLVAGVVALPVWNYIRA